MQGNINFIGKMAGVSPSPGSTSLPPVTAQPILKWAGGKRRLLEQYAPYFAREFANYHEPFLGGGAVYFWLWSQRRLENKTCHLSDINPELINFYSVLKTNTQELCQLLAYHQQQHNPEHYYSIRAQAPALLSPVQRAARLLYLNRTCFNGLYRENSRGQFNVPIGRYKNPGIFQKEKLLTTAQALSSAQLSLAPYWQVETRAQTGDLVYFDPPYQPLTSTASFTAYTQHNFNQTDQIQLAQLFKRLHQRGVNVLLSNSDSPLVHELYQDFPKHQIYAPRAINSRADRRAKISELLISG